MYGTENHFLRTRSFFPFSRRLLDQLIISQTFEWNALGRGRGKAESHLVFQDQGKGGSDMFASLMTNATLPTQAVAFIGGSLDRHNCCWRSVSSVGGCWQ